MSWGWTPWRQWKGEGPSLTKPDFVGDFTEPQSRKLSSEETVGSEEWRRCLNKGIVQGLPGAEAFISVSPTWSFQGPT